jgi:hypothetical protein
MVQKGKQYMNFEDKYENSGGGGNAFIKLEDGESVTGVFVGEPYQFKQHNKWPEKPVLCTGVGCPDCLAGANAAVRFRLNLIVKEDGVLVPKIFEQGYYTWVTLQELNKEYDIERYTLKIKRVGVKTDTRYTILPIPDGKLDDGALGKLQQIELLKLEHKGVATESTPPPIDDGDLPNFDTEDDIPF